MADPTDPSDDVGSDAASAPLALPSADRTMRYGALRLDPTADPYAASRPSAPEIEWDELAPGRETSATVLMASGFALRGGQAVRERYRIARVLGEGAMGQVLAVTLVDSADEQTYALKVVARPLEADGPGGEVDAAAVAEAERQSQYLAEVLRAEAAKQEVAQRHGVPVARLFALVQLDDGSIGLRMELARGSSLDARIEAALARAHEPPDVERAVLIVRKLLSQLRRLHELRVPGSPRGFVHSDVKPGNVFVDDEDPTDLVVTLLDFGVATAGHALALDAAQRQVAARRTLMARHAGGTPGYAPPWHFDSDATPLSDVYASVVLLYELVALALPWRLEAAGTRPDDVPAIERAMLRGPRPVRAVRPAVPPALAAVLDDFFAREFAELNVLAADARAARASGEAGALAAIDARLACLARDYQQRLDQLRAHVAQPGARRPISSPPEPLPDARRSPPTVSAPPVATSRAPSRANLPPASRVAARWARTPLGALSLRVWPGAAAAALVVAVCAAVALGSRGEATVRADTRAAATTALPLAAGPSTPPPPTAPPPATRAAHPAGSAAHGVDLAAVLGARGSAAGAGERAPRPTACACRANVHDTEVVATGGWLDHEIVLCTASRPTAGAWTGTGAIPPEVFGALPRIECMGRAAAFELVVHRATSGGVPSFECRRVLRPARASDRGAAAPAADADAGAAAPDAG